MGRFSRNFTKNKTGMSKKQAQHFRNLAAERERRLEKLMEMKSGNEVAKERLQESGKFDFEL